MKLNYQKRLTLSFLAIFILFTAGIVVFEQQRAKEYKTEALVERLDAYAGIAEEYVESHPGAGLQELTDILPDNLRLSLISADGRVIYDNLFNDPGSLENHIERPEIIKAREYGDGYFVRTSASNSLPYLYYAKYYGNSYVRVALPYDIQVRSFLKPDNGFLYFILGMFVIGFLFIYLAGRRFGRSIRELRDFSVSASENIEDITMPRFPNDELGEIGRQIVRDYTRVKDNEIQIKQEKEKLLQHVQSSAEGICFFNPDGKVAFYNGLFLQYLNNISYKTVTSLGDMLGSEPFAPVRKFLDDRYDENYYEMRVNRQGKDFLIRVNVFDDDSFEIILNDITTQEKTRRLKQEMTGNIAHELRTPVTSIRGFLETILENDLDPEKEREFLQRAYNQTRTLSELITDMSLLTKMEQAPGSFGMTDVRIADVIEKVRADSAAAMTDKGIVFESSVSEEVMVKGNENLLYAIFRNLTDNVVRHAGENIRISIGCYDRKDGLVYFSFADSGSGIKDEAFLNRLFERFYRPSEGRTRDTGGSGLGLSIVKNAVLYHGGTITVKNRPEGGLEFLFPLPSETEA